MMPRPHGIALLTALLAATTASAETEPAPAADAVQPSAPQASPEALIGHLNDELLEVLRRSGELDYQQRFDVLAPTLRACFDLEYMARQVVGRGFLDLDEASRQRWYELFATYTTANDASRFDHFSAQKFEIVESTPAAKETVLVRTRVIDPAAENVDLSYRVRQGDAGWRVIDVFLKGTVSEIALRRAEYAAVLKRDGFAALTTSIQERIDKLASDAAGEPSD